MGSRLVWVMPGRVLTSRTYSFSSAVTRRSTRVAPVAPTACTARSAALSWLAAAALSEQKNLKVGVGFMWRHSKARQETIKRIHDGLIGEILDLTRLDDPGRKLEQAPLDLGEIVDEVVCAADIEARAGNVIVVRALAEKSIYDKLELDVQIPAAAYRLKAPSGLPERVLDCP